MKDNITQYVKQITLFHIWEFDDKKCSDLEWDHTSDKILMKLWNTAHLIQYWEIKHNKQIDEFDYQIS